MLCTGVKTLFVVCLMFHSFQGAPPQGKLIVNLSAIRNSQGIVRILLFNNKDGFPNQPGKALQYLDEKIANGACAVTFENIPYGTYAVCAYHDANANGEFDETWYGMPKEGVGNPVSRLLFPWSICEPMICIDLYRYGKPHIPCTFREASFHGFCHQK